MIIKSHCVDCHHDFEYTRNTNNNRGGIRKTCDECRAERIRVSSRKSAARQSKSAGSRRTPDAPKTVDGDRVCSYDECRCPLSKYNDDIYCSLHQDIITQEARAEEHRKRVRKEVRRGVRKVTPIRPDPVEPLPRGRGHGFGASNVVDLDQRRNRKSRESSDRLQNNANLNNGHFKIVGGARVWVTSGSR